MNSWDITPYRMTIIGAIIVLALSYAALVALGGVQGAGPYLTLVGSVAIPALLALLRADQAAQQQKLNHRENQALITENQSQIAENHSQIAELADALEKRSASVDQQLVDAVEAGRQQILTEPPAQSPPPSAPTPTPKEP